ncbi:MAG: NAD(+) synthase [bacterium]
MQYIKVGGAALNQTPLDWSGNRERIVGAIRQARAQGVQVLCLPELCISGYGCEDAFHSEALAGQALASLAEILPETEGLAVAVGLPFLYDGNLFNVAALLADGRVAGLAAKKVLAGYGVYYEPRWFQPWPAGVVAGATVVGAEVPLGDLTFDLDGVLLGFEICEDAWGRAHSAAATAGRPADILLNPSASHFALDKIETLRGIVREGSRAAHAVYLYSNLVGNEAGRLIFDGAVMIASNGAMVAENRRFSFREVGLVSAVVELETNRLERRRLAYPANPGHLAGRVNVAHRFAEPSPESVREFRLRATASNGAVTGEGPPEPPMGRHEEFARAVSLGLWDYLRKSKNRGFAVSLSGGADSSSVAVLCWSMVRLALAELGPAEFGRMLGHIPELPGPKPGEEAGRELVGRLLTTVYQATPNSSKTTRQAARELAGFLGARHLELEVGPLVEAYEQLAEQALGRKLSWAADDIARQNIQARVRSPGIWLIANLEGLLLLSTSNRSEVGVGYTTMDGDTSGGLAPIAGANKTFLQGWLRWMEAAGMPGLGPLPPLAAVNAQAPTAELRPPDKHQRDETDLMPYRVLDAIEQAAIRDRMAPVQVWRTLLLTPLPGIELEPRTAAGFVERFFELWSRTQWKRERLAPSFHLDDENLDPRTWCRFPILSSGYETELAELRRAVETEGAPR